MNDKAILNTDQLTYNDVSPEKLDDVVLRNMLFVGPIWVGESIVMKLPTGHYGLYPIYQYLRTFRWIICLLIPIIFTANNELSLDYQWVKLVGYFTIAIITYFLIWLILKNEHYRLVKIDKSRKIVTIKASDQVKFHALMRIIKTGLIE